MNRMKTVTLEINSWAGISIGAVHCYGDLHYEDADGKYQKIEVRRTLTAASAFKLMKQKNHNKNPSWFVEFDAGDTTECFDDIGSIKKIAIKQWKKLCPDAELLICGRYAVCDPQEILAADDPEVMTLINEMCDEAEFIGHYEGNYDTMRKISNLYAKLVERDEYRG